MSTTTTGAQSLLVPSGWVVDPSSVARLTRTLAEAPPSISGIVAPGGDLPPGSSFRVHAERLALAHDEGLEDVDGAIQGAVLLREGVTWRSVGPDFVVDEGRVVVDRGSYAHDPWSVTDVIEPATAAGRPPFSRRPLVLFLCCAAAPEPELLDWIRNAVNALMPRNIEGRLAAHAVTSGLRLARPCAPTEASVHALDPDVIVTADPIARDVAPEWCAGDRRTVLVDLELDPTRHVDLVSWRIGAAAGRLRARIGRAVTPTELANLVNRLCAGPQPEPPRREGPRDVTVPVHTTKRRRSPDAQDVVFVRSGETGDPANRLEALARVLTALGSRPRVVDDHDAEASAARCAILGSATAPEAARYLVELRNARQLVTIIDVDAPLTDEIVELADSCGHAISSSPSVVRAMRENGVRAQYLPRFVTLEELSRVPALRRTAPRVPPLAIGVMAHEGGELDELASAALERLLDADEELELHWFGELAESATLRTRVEACNDTASADLLAPLAVTFHASSSTDVEFGRCTAIMRSFLMGVPSLFNRATSPDAIDGVTDAFGYRAEADVDEILSLTTRALAGSRSVVRSQLAERADSLYGMSPSFSAVRRVFGWAARLRPRS